MNARRGSLCLSLAALLAASAAQACGPSSDCDLGERFYRIRMPQQAGESAPVGAVVFAHGYKGSARGVMKNRHLEKVTRELGVALIATRSSGAGWSLPGSPSHSSRAGTDELAYFDAVVDDATRRFPIDPERIMVTGFSAGGMMVWNLICHRSERFAAFAPMAGTFWRPEPKTCDTPPAHVLHIHGATDRTVPLHGRPVGDTHQGDVPKVVAMYARYGRYGNPVDVTIGEMQCLNRTNPDGRIFNYCLFPGRHSFKSRYVAFAWKTFAAAGAL